MGQRKTFFRIQAQKPTLVFATNQMPDNSWVENTIIIIVSSITGSIIRKVVGV